MINKDYLIINTATTAVRHTNSEPAVETSAFPHISEILSPHPIIPKKYMKQDQEEKLKYGVAHWNKWRSDLHWFTDIDLSGIRISGNFKDIDFRDANLARAIFYEAILDGADFRDSNLTNANFTGCRLIRCDFRGACLNGTIFKNAKLTESNFGAPDLVDKTLQRASSYPRRRPTQHTSAIGSSFIGSNLNRVKSECLFAEKANFAGASIQNAFFAGAVFRGSNLNGASCVDTDFRGSDFSHASLVATDFSRADISSSYVYGTSAWDLTLNSTIQTDIIITPQQLDPIVTDNLELAQFLFLLLNNSKIRGAIDAITTRVILILGRFTEHRKLVLDELRVYIRSMGFIPVLFDFEKPRTRNTTETVLTLANLSRYVIADLTDSRCVPHELQAIIPNLRSVLIQPICATTDVEYSMFADYSGLPSVLPIIRYDLVDQLKRDLCPVLCCGT